MIERTYFYWFFTNELTSPYCLFFWMDTGLQPALMSLLLPFSFNLWVLFMRDIYTIQLSIPLYQWGKIIVMLILALKAVLPCFSALKTGGHIWGLWDGTWWANWELDSFIYWGSDNVSLKYMTCSKCIFES